VQSLDTYYTISLGKKQGKVNYRFIDYIKVSKPFALLLLAAVLLMLLTFCSSLGEVGRAEREGLGA
jgi:hypothetical protein